MKRFWVILLLLTFAAVRIPGANSQLWLDEIWSIRLAQKAVTPLGVFTSLHHDNNHWLNTLALQFLGPGRPYWEYRVLPETCGIGTVLLGWLIAAEYGFLSGICALILLGASEFLIEFSSDARGYAPAGFFALLCVWLLRRHLRSPRRWTAILMAASAVLGLLSHLTFLVILCGLIAASVVGSRRRGGWAAAVGHAAVWWAVPIAAIILLYLIDLQYMIRGGGPLMPRLSAQTAGMILGLPVLCPPWLARAIGAAAWVVALLSLRRRIQAADSCWPVYAVALLLVPVFLFCLPSGDYLHPRYLYVAVPLLLILLGAEIGYWLERTSRNLRLVLAAVVVLFVALNAIQADRFIRLGRGDYAGALQYLVSHTNGPNIVLGADLHPVSTLMVMDYYRYEVPLAGHRLYTLRGSQWGGQWPQWIIAEVYYGQIMRDQDEIPYVLRAVFRNGGVVSGINWAIYEAQSGDSSVRPGNLKALDEPQ